MMAVHSSSQLSSTSMNTTCSCGFDCSDFITHHSISAGARFECPRCESTVYAAEISEAPSAEPGGPEMAGTPSASAA
jgi:hypothetical protein